MKRHTFSYDIEQVAPYIDWSYLLHAWGIKEAENAEEVMHDAGKILEEMQGRYCTKGIFALFDAAGKGEDIIFEGTALPLLR